jgi:bromodomain and PHD finger-containing protein 1
MDAFEKEALRQNPPPALHDEEVQLLGFSGVNLELKKQRKSPGAASQHTPCCVCWRVGGCDQNELLFCGRCHLAVHRECYGVERSSKRGPGSRLPGQCGRPWFCTRCELDVAEAQQSLAAVESPSSPTPSVKAALSVSTVVAEAPTQVVPGWGVGTGECCLCPVKGGALKPSDDNRWCHIICAIWIPEPCISNVAKMQPIGATAFLRGRPTR